jgi:hypothetical protein
MNPNVCTYVVLLCVSVFIVCIRYVSYRVFPVNTRSLGFSGHRR